MSDFTGLMRRKPAPLAAASRVRRGRACLFGILVLLCAAIRPTPSQAAVTTDPAEASVIAIEAYEYLYPIVLMDVTRQVMTQLPAGSKPGAGPENHFSHVRSFPDASFREIVRPNLDTLYSIAWLNLQREPMIVSMPDTAGRYFIMPLYDMWTDVFAAPGSRTSGTAAADWAIVPPGWQGQLPKDVRRIDAPDAHAAMIVRVQTNGASDYDAVHALQERMRITPLSQWKKSTASPGASSTNAPKASSGIDLKTEPKHQVARMSAAEFFARGMRLLALHPAHATDWSMLERMRRIGLQAGQPFDMQAASPVVREALSQAPATALRRFQQTMPNLGHVRNGWLVINSSIGVYGNDYLHRAVIAMVGLFGLPPDDSIYPFNLADADGKPLRGDNAYVLHFDKTQLPPVDAFWSVTMYDADGFLVDNPLKRYALGDRDALTYNADGSLDLYLQHDDPGAQRHANWLPTPATGPLGVTMRLYAPRVEAIDGRWSPPVIRRASP
jgi:hypothetical protein